LLEDKPFFSCYKAKKKDSSKKLIASSIAARTFLLYTKRKSLSDSKKQSSYCKTKKVKKVSPVLHTTTKSMFFTIKNRKGPLMLFFFLCLACDKNHKLNTQRTTQKPFFIAIYLFALLQEYVERKQRKKTESHHDPCFLFLLSSFSFSFSCLFFFFSFFSFLGPHSLLSRVAYTYILGFLYTKTCFCIYQAKYIVFYYVTCLFSHQNLTLLWPLCLSSFSFSFFVLVPFFFVLVCFLDPFSFLSLYKNSRDFISCFSVWN